MTIKQLTAKLDKEARKLLAEKVALTGVMRYPKNRDERIAVKRFYLLGGMAYGLQSAARRLRYSAKAAQKHSSSYKLARA
jgi:hypothetical protein